MANQIAAGAGSFSILLTILFLILSNARPSSVGWREYWLYQILGVGFLAISACLIALGKYFSGVLSDSLGVSYTIAAYLIGAPLVIIGLIAAIRLAILVVRPNSVLLDYQVFENQTADETQE